MTLRPVLNVGAEHGAHVAQFPPRLTQLGSQLPLIEIDRDEQLDYWAYIKFVNGVRRAIGVQRGKALLLKIDDAGTLALLRSLE